MRTSGILTIGGGIAGALGALFALGMFNAALHDKQPFPFWVGFLVGAGVVVAGASAFFAGKRRARLEREEDERGFAELAVALARKSGGPLKLEAVCKAADLTTEEAQAKMRKLTGLGVFELDFDANGQAVYKVAAGAGAAELALPAGR
jgi:hypothetical protein